MKNHLWKSKILVAIVIGLFSLMVFTETVPSTKSLYSRLMAQGKEFYENGEFEKAAAKYQSAQAVAANNEEMAEANFLLALTYYALVEMENCQNSLEKYFSVSVPSADPFLGKDFPPKFKDVFKAQKREYLQRLAGTETPAQVKKKKIQTQPSVREEETIAPQAQKKKKFPVLLLIAVTLVAGAAIYYFTVVNNKYTLTTSMGTGVNGAPASGAVKYKKDSVVSYNYSVASGYSNLVVTLDGTQVAASGTVTMDQDHSLSATAVATPVVENYVLTVAKNAGVNGTPETGAYTYAQGTTVNYSYTAATGYTDLAVKLDNATVAASGTFVMNANHSLTATAVQGPVAGSFTLTVTTSAGVEGTPPAGVYTYTTITLVNYSYTAASGYANLVVKLNNVPVAASGLLIMKENLNLSVTATHL